MEYVESFRGLEVYKLSRQLSKEIYALTKRFLKEDGEQQETQHWVETALDCSYLSQEVADNLLKHCSSIGKMLNSMISKSAAFCKPSTKK